MIKRPEPPAPLVFPWLTGWRFPLALWVIFYHLNATFFDLFHPPDAVMTFFQKGYLAVDLFFMISGMVITHNYADQLKDFNRKDYLNFLWLRLARLYPLHLFILGALAGMIVLSHLLDYRINQPGDYTIPLFIANLFMVQAWSFPDHLDWNHPAWSISAEWLIYLLCPLLFWMLSRPWKRVFYIVFGVLALCLAPAIYHFSAQHNGTHAIPRIIGGFTAGACLYYILPIRKRLLTQPGFWNHPAWLYLGNLSYAVYMVQFPILLAMRKLWPHQMVMPDDMMMHVTYVAIVLILIIGSAILCHHLIEEPARRYLRARNPFRR